MHTPYRSVSLRYGIVPLAVALALVLRSALLGGEMPFLLLWPVVMVCAWFGGFGPGLLATCLSAIVTACLFFEPPHWFAFTKPADWAGMVLFVLLGSAISLLCDLLRRAKQNVEQYAREAVAQREWFRVTLGSIGDAVIATDTEGRVTFMNAVAQCLTGWKAEEAQALPSERVFRIINEHTRIPVENPVNQVLQSGGTDRLANDTVLLSKAGAELPIVASAAPIRTERGGVQGIVLVFRDVTERRRLENDLRRQAQELIEADHHKNEFLAMLGHELRNPLAPIQNAVQVLKRFCHAQPVLQRATEVIERQAHQARKLVEDLMDISRISQGKISLQKEPLELAQVVAQAVEESRPLMEARSHQFTVNLPNEAVRLEADPTRLTQVVANLLNNAAKYTGEGAHIELTVEQNGAEAVLRVRDNGIGITQAMLPRVFDLFAQSERALSKSQGGLGMGLKLVRSLVEMHGGAVQVFSDGPDQGSEFVVRLPVIDKVQEWQGPTKDEKRSSDSYCSRRILVVDDNRDAAEGLALLLKVSGYEVLTAYDGLAALEAARTFQPEVALLDINLPKLDGYEVARRLRLQPGLETALLIAVSGYGLEEDRHRSQEAGFDLHLVKPVEPKALENALPAVTNAISEACLPKRKMVSFRDEKPSPQKTP